ncbi:MAG: DUF1289 domain-containing protein [Thermaurantiacus sp.]
MDGPASPKPRSIPSPCRDICKLRRRSGVRLCIGCGRTTEEIAAWPTADDERRRAIRVAASARLARG